MTRGALYIVYGAQALAQFKLSLASLRRFAPGLPVAVVAAHPVDGADHQVQHPEADPGARLQKTSMYTLSPFEQTLFLDADTELRSSPEAGFNLLGYVDVVLGQDLHRVMATNRWPHHNPDEVKQTAAQIGTDQHMYFNSGVIFFRRNARVEQMMAAWGDEWNRYGTHDQMALQRALHRCPVRIAPMRAPWNTRNASEAAFVFHKHHQARREGAPQ